jgi:2-haloacid dehalogenase
MIMEPGGVRHPIVFDAFGTLFDTTAVEVGLTERFGADGRTIATTWRTIQLQTTWQRSLIGSYEPFDRITRTALVAAVRLAGHALDEREIDVLAAAYERLPLYPEVAGILDELARRASPLAILSNGTPAMLRALVAAVGLGDRFVDLLSVDTVRVYKPHPSVYALVGQRFAIEPSAVRFVSGNAWDCAGASRSGFDVTWIDRSGTGLAAFEPLGVRPDRSGPDLRVALSLVTAG